MANFNGRLWIGTMLSSGDSPDRSHETNQTLALEPYGLGSRVPT
jgi:hypothetical protein